MDEEESNGSRKTLRLSMIGGGIVVVGLWAIVMSHGDKPPAPVNQGDPDMKAQQEAEAQLSSDEKALIKEWSDLCTVAALVPSRCKTGTFGDHGEVADKTGCDPASILSSLLGCAKKHQARTSRKEDAAKALLPKSPKLACELLYFDCKDANEFDLTTTDVCPPSGLDLSSLLNTNRNHLAKTPTWQQAGCETFVPEFNKTQKRVHDQVVKRESRAMEASFRADDAERTISVSRLYSAFNRNEVAANEKYEDKQIIVTGTIESIGEALGTAVLDLGNAHATMSDKADTDKVKKLRPGRHIKLECECHGLSMLGGVSLEECDFAD